MLHNVSLNASMRANLLSLQQTSKLQDITSNRLSTGLKVNSAIDNPSAYYTAQSLSDRASDLNALLDAMSQGIQTLKTVAETIDAASGFLQQAKAVASQALETAQNIAARVSTEEELLAAVSSGKKGLIVVNGKITLGENTELKLKDGQSLVGSSYVNGSAGSVSELVFKTNDGTGRGAISAGSNSIISDLKISYTSNADVSALNGAVVVDNAENVRLNNLDIDFAVTSANENYTKSAVYINNSRNVIMSGDFKITAREKARAFQAYNNSEVFFENIVADFESQKANGICLDNSQLYFGKNATVNVLTSTESCDALYNINGSVKITDNARIKLHTTANKASGYRGDADSLLHISGNAKINVRTEGVTSYGFYGGKVKTDGQAQINVLTTGLNGEGFINTINDMGGSSVVNIEARGENGDGFNNCRNYFRNNVKINVNLSGYSADALAYNTTDIYDSAVITLLSEQGRSMYGGNSSRNIHINIHSANAVINSKSPNAFNQNVSLTSVAGAAINTINGAYVCDQAITAVNMSLGNTPPAEFTRTGEADLPSLPDIEKEMEDKQAPWDEDGESGSLGDIQTNKARFDKIIRQYDALINDGSYKGVNLLKNDSLKVSFNEDRSSYLNIAGVDASSQALGLTGADWLFKSDVEKSLSGLDAAIASLRDFAARFGTYNNIVTTRQEFTEAMINVLEEGADKLTLADMNQESANMLALQTRQMLAVNSLSLASQASRAVLYIF